MEMTMTTPGALNSIRAASDQLSAEDVFIGAGTVLDAAMAEAAISAGARFVVGPGFDAEMVRLCNTRGVPVIPGALTPTEIIGAWKAGADVVKIFPAELVGPGYLRAIKEPLPQIELLPTKGIDFDTVRSYLDAGAIAVGVGAVLLSNEMIENKEFSQITRNARRFTNLVREARGAR